MKFPTAVLIILTLFLSGCNINEVENGELIPLDSKIFFEVIEMHISNDETGQPEIVLNMVTEKNYPNFNYGIANNIGIIGNTIDIQITGIHIPSVVLPAFGPARAIRNLSLQNGNYNLRLRYQNFSNEYTLTVTDSSLIVNGNSTENTEPFQNLFWRYPENSFVYLCGTTIEDSLLCHEFLNTLYSTLHLTEFRFPDSGKIPYPSSSEGHQYNMPAKYFLYQTENDFERIEDALKRFKQEKIRDKQGIGISIINWLNKKYLSWMM